MSVSEKTLESRPLTGRIHADGTVVDLADYRAAGGYKGMQEALRRFTPAEVIARVEQAGLRGRGGAGFPTGIKWKLVPQGEDAPAIKYLVANADEMEPGTFKDRLLMERDPHQLIEGMIIAAYAIQATQAFIFLRGEYVMAAERLNAAVAEAQAAGLLGQNIEDTGWGINIHVHTGAGRYICGDETALINSLEGRRANPRAKPPFPQIAGLFGRPTVVNNAETLCNLPHIMRLGPDWYTHVSVGADAGTKMYGASGRVKTPGIWELPMGTPARQIFEEHAGGMAAGYQLRAFLPGGASTDFLLPEFLDTPMDFDGFGKIRSRMGTGTMIMLDDKASLLGTVRNLEVFFARESCGWCTPCRDGLPWTVKLLMALERGEGRAEDITMLEKLSRDLGPGRTFCALAPGAMSPLGSALKLFRGEFERGVAGAVANEGRAA